jgi:putative lipoprotein
VKRAAACLILLCAGCAGLAEAGPERGLVPYACGDETAVARFSDGAVSLALTEADLRLPQVPAASGARYEADGTLFWIRGEEALLERAGGPARTCAVGPPARWRDAAEAGTDLRAVGQEPGWLLDLDLGKGIVLRADYGETVVSTPAPAPGAGTLSWHARAGSRRLSVAAEERVCRDAMSGQPYPLAVAVTLDEQVLHGCGTWLGGSHPMATAPR